MILPDGMIRKVRLVGWLVEREGSREMKIARAAIALVFFFSFFVDISYYVSKRGTFQTVYKLKSVK